MTSVALLFSSKRLVSTCLSKNHWARTIPKSVSTLQSLKFANNNYYAVQPRFNHFLVAAKNINLTQTSTRYVTTESSTSTTKNHQNNNRNNENNKSRICQAALAHVPTLGWTQDAITKAVVQDLNWNITMTGLVTPTDLVEYCMKDWNQRFRIQVQELKSNNSNGAILSPKEMIQLRLQYIVPFKQNWHEAMAIGLQNPFTTREQLHEIIEIISAASINNTLLSLPQKTMLGAIYAATELHLLTDTSMDNHETWTFLHLRMQEYESGSMMIMPQLDSFPITATTAVATSLVEGLASLVLPSSITKR